MSTRKGDNSLLNYITLRSAGDIVHGNKSTRCKVVELRRHILKLAEEKASGKNNIEKECDLQGYTKTTFSVVFSHDGRRMASLHGDHNIRIVDVFSGRCIKVLQGHPRSPWTVDFHQTYPDILASGCLDGEVRIWDLSSGDYDIWRTPQGNAITSLSLHPTHKILLIAQANTVYIWNWELFAEPDLYGTSKRNCEQVKWVKFTSTGDAFYTGITDTTEYDWDILRRTPSIFELNQHRQRSQHDEASSRNASARARSQYEASMNVTVSLRDMFENPLEISNDLLGNQASGSDTYHAATTYAQLHGIHTGNGHSPLNPGSDGNRSDSSRNRVPNPRNNPQQGARQEEQGQADDNDTWQRTARAYGIFGACLMAETLNKNTATKSENQEESSAPASACQSNSTAAATSSESSMSQKNSLIHNALMSSNAKSSDPPGRSMHVPLKDRLESGSSSTTSSNNASDAQANQSTARVDCPTLFGVPLGSLSDRSGPSLLNGSLASQLSNSSASSQSASLAARQIACSVPKIKRPFIRDLHADYYIDINQAVTDGATSSSNNGTASGAPAATGAYSSILSQLTNNPSSRSSSAAISNSLSTGSGRTTPNGPAGISSASSTQSGSQESSFDQAESRGWSDIHKILSTLEGLRGPRRFSSSLPDLVARCEAIVRQPGVLQSETSFVLQLRDRISFQLSQTHNGNSNPRLSAELRTKLLGVCSLLTQTIEQNIPERVEGSSSIRNGVTNRTAAGAAANTPQFANRISSVSSRPGVAWTRGMRSSESTDESQSNPANGSDNFALSREQALGARRRVQRSMTSDSMMSDNVMSRNQRIQRWSLHEKPDYFHSKDVIVRLCKIHNDCGIDVSQDGQLLAVFVQNPRLAVCPGFDGMSRRDTLLRIISLNEQSLGQLLHQVQLEPGPVSVSISPLANYVVVGFAGCSMSLEPAMILYDIFELPTEGNPEPKTQAVRSARKSLHCEQRIKVNCVKWLPNPGQGLVIGTNQGNVIINHTLTTGYPQVMSSKRLFHMIT